MKQYLNKKVFFSIAIILITTVFIIAVIFLGLIWYLQSPRVTNNDFIQVQNQPIQLNDKYELKYLYLGDSENETKFIVENSNGEMYVLPDFYSMYNGNFIRSTGWQVKNINGTDYLYLTRNNPGSALGYFYRIINISKDVPVEVNNNLNPNLSGIFDKDTEFITCSEPKVLRNGNLEFYSPTNDCETRFPQTIPYEVDLESENNIELEKYSWN